MSVQEEEKKEEKNKKSKQRKKNKKKKTKKKRSRWMCVSGYTMLTMAVISRSLTEITQTL